MFWHNDRSDNYNERSWGALQNTLGKAPEGSGPHRKASAALNRRKFIYATSIAIISILAGILLS